jgi:hypothetical protein
MGVSPSGCDASDDSDVDFLMKIIRPLTPDRGLSFILPTQTGGSATAVRKRVRGGLGLEGTFEYPLHRNVISDSVKSRVLNLE